MSSSVDSARDYCNSDDADKFYYTIWGGNDIHIGLYENHMQPIAKASQKTVERMAKAVKNISYNTRVLDLGSGYGGSARWLAKEYGCKVTCLNLSEVQNKRNRAMTHKERLDHLIEVVDGDFEHLPFGDGTFDLIWSQDAFLHSSNRKGVIKEIARVLVPTKGAVIFTDPMAAVDAKEEQIAAIKQRLSIDTFGSQKFYEDEFGSHGFEVVSFDGHGDQLTMHYSKVLEELSIQREALQEEIPNAYIENVEAGLRNWIRGGKDGQLDWGIHLFRR